MTTHTTSPASVHVYRQLPMLVDAKNPHPGASCASYLAHLQFLAEFEPAVELSVCERFKLLQIRAEDDRFLLSIQSEPLT